MIIYENMYFTLSEDKGSVSILTKQEGFLLKDFDAILRQHLRVKLVNFAALKIALSKKLAQPMVIGEWLPVVTLEVARDQMSATITIFETTAYIQAHEAEVRSDIEQLLRANKIVHGILPLDLQATVPGKATLIAQGTPPVKGEDAQVTYLEIPERRPVIGEDGRANYFDMNFIYEIEEGSWLGEKIPLQQGTAGINILGLPVAGVPGKDTLLVYDTKSAYENDEEGKTVLRSRKKGVLEEVQGLLQVQEHLVIQGDVGVETGNLDYDGSITVRGTVQAGFSVIAKGDIAIESKEGVSGATLIKSLEGDIFIRGGIFGLDKTRVEAGGNVFVKHVNEAHLIAGNDIQIGFYSLGATLQAHAIYVNERTGKIIGGKAIARSVITASIVGNHLERKTELIIASIDQKDRVKEVQDKAQYLKGLQEELIDLEGQVQRITPYVNSLNKQQLAAYEQARQRLKRIREESATIDREIKQLMEAMRTAGQEEIYVTKEAFPGTYIQIGKKSTTLSKKTNGKFLLEFGELNV